MQRRLTENEAYLLRMHLSFAESLKVTGINLDCEAAEQMIEQNTTDGRPYVEPPLTDEDARQRPWVMLRDYDSHSFGGPRRLVAVTHGNIEPRYYVTTIENDHVTSWRQCRRATPEEIAAAGLKVTE